MSIPNEDEVSRRAYALWEQAGRPEGQHETHWHLALKELGLMPTEDGETGRTRPLFPEDPSAEEET